MQRAHPRCGPHERDASQRRAKGLKLNHPEAVAIITAAALEAAREGKTVEETMTIAAKALTVSDVMEGVIAAVCRLPNEAGLVFKVAGVESETVRDTVRTFWSRVRRVVTGCEVPPPFAWR